MSMVALYLFNALLLTRLFLLFRDEVVSLRYAGATWALQMLILLPLTPWKTVALLALALSAMNLAWFWAERWFSSRLYLVRLVTLFLSFLSLGIFLAPIAGVGFRDSFSGLETRVGEYFVFADLIGALNWRTIAVVMLGMLLCISEANIVVRVVIENFNLKPSDSDSSGETKPVEAAIEYKRGRVIGLLERLILFYLVLGHQFGALGFVIAAKTMARFKNLEDKNFAEYFLVGTLLSIAAAGCVALFTGWLLSRMPA
jgi:hypothetical protein